MMEEQGFDLAALLREEERLSDEAFVNDVDWLIALEIGSQMRQQASLKRWALDLGAATGVAAIGYAMAAEFQDVNYAISSASLPLLVAVTAPVLWLITKQEVSTS